MDINFKAFINELSSLSPLSGEYEANMAVLNIYTSILFKNTSNLLIHAKNDDVSNLDDFKNKLNFFNEVFENNFNASSDFIKNYIVAIKMNTSSQSQVEKYESTMQDISITKISAYFEILEALNKIVSSHEICKNLFKEHEQYINNLAISNIKNIFVFIIKSAKDACNDIFDENIAFDFLNKIKNFEKIV